ncbi:hypothetical protein GCM10022252_43440 [Streptosporangium oxazolinicum]|uniref:Uncharacterized protein n=1 Tax=Streptosporangium oxazolinicum TaxID=909287 RepID=A0ABP8B297_9ACTN
MKIMKAFKAIGVSALMAGAILVPTTAAHAYPASCSDLYRDNAYWYNCTKGTGSFQAVVRCYRIGHSTYTIRYGGWKGIGAGPSIAQCLSNEETSSGYGVHRG